MPELFFRVRNLKKAFAKHLVLSGVNLDVFKGEVLGIIGTSGSGKTTLLHTIIGFQKPDKGEVRVLYETSHRALGDPTYKDVHKNLTMIKNVYGFASQMPSFYDTLTVTENLKYFGSLYEMPKHTIDTNTQILLHLMDLELARKSLGKNLSGGMERRLDIACALMHDPAVLILDEPTADLDPVLRNHIYDLIRKINAKDTTIILASHHLADLERVCDRIAILKDGKIFTVGTLDEIKDRFSDYSLVQIRLAKHQYQALADEMKQHKQLFARSEVFNNGIVFYSDKPNECAREAMSIARRLKDKVDDLHIGKPSLDEIFVAIMEQDRADKEERRKRSLQEQSKKRSSTPSTKQRKDEEKKRKAEEKKKKREEEKKRKEDDLKKREEEKKRKAEEKKKKREEEKKKQAKKEKESASIDENLALLEDRLVDKELDKEGSR